MRLIGGLLLFLLLAVCSNACFEPPQFSIIPVISYNSIVFKPKKASIPNSSDTLILIVNFKDGDGDLGLDSTDVVPPYENKDYFVLDGEAIYFPPDVPVANPTPLDSAGVIVVDTLISYKTKRKWALDQNPNNDTLPLYQTPFCCTKWDLIETNSKVSDTLACRLNPNYYNIFIDIYILQPDHSFKLFDFSEEFGCSFCQTQGYNGRFPILSSDPDKKGPLEGIIRYDMVSSLWTAFFSIKTLQLHITIQDRALHQSNIVITKAFQLSDITQN